MTEEFDGLSPASQGIVRTIFVGGRTKQELRELFHTCSVQLNDYGERLFDDSDWAPSASRYMLETVEVTVRQLGFSEGAVSADLFERAGEHGLGLCSLEVAPFLRLQLVNQPLGQYLTVASPKLSREPDFPNGFYLRRLEDGLWLRGYTASEDHVFEPDFRFVFCQPETEFI